MNRDLKLFFLAVGLPALMLALAGLRLLQVEASRARVINSSTLQAKADYAAADLSKRIGEGVEGVFDRLARLPGRTPGPWESLDQALGRDVLAGRPRMRGWWGSEMEGLFRVTAATPFARRAYFREEAPGGSPDARGVSSVLHGASFEPVAWLRPNGETNRVVMVDLEPLAFLARLPGWLEANGTDRGLDREPRPDATLVEVRQEDGTLLCPASLEPPADGAFAEASLAPPFAHWRVRVYYRAGGGDAGQTVRLIVVGGCLLLLLFTTLVAGGWMLVRAAAKARQAALQQTDFVSNVSHELKTPLTTICLCAELAAEEDDPARRGEALASIVGEAERLSRLVANVLDFSRLERQARTYACAAFDLAALARDVGALLEERFQAHGLVLPEGSCTAFADRDAVRQIVLNLVDNAAKYAAAAGPVALTVRTVDGRAELAVADRGPGFLNEGLAHAFDRFWRADNSVTRTTGGNGLGLAIARGLARGMGGDLTVAVREGGGSVFTLALPGKEEGHHG